MSIKVCPTCEAKWIDGQHYWATNKKGNEKDLAGLVCNNLANGRPCINPCKGDETGDTWKKRFDRMDVISKEFDLS